MTNKNSRKQRVRQRMEQTGETYTTALKNILAEQEGQPAQVHNDALTKLIVDKISLGRVQKALTQPGLVLITGKDHNVAKELNKALIQHQLQAGQKVVDVTSRQPSVQQQVQPGQSALERLLEQSGGSSLFQEDLQAGCAKFIINQNPKRSELYQPTTQNSLDKLAEQHSTIVLNEIATYADLALVRKHLKTHTVVAFIDAHDIVQGVSHLLGFNSFEGKFPIFDHLNIVIQSEHMTTIKDEDDEIYCDEQFNTVYPVGPEVEKIFNLTESYETCKALLNDYALKDFIYRVEDYGLDLVDEYGIEEVKTPTGEILRLKTPDGLKLTPEQLDDQEQRFVSLNLYNSTRGILDPFDLG
jgi:hypothetical protein